MQKTKISCIALLAMLMMAVLPLMANASTGYILINTTTAPSTVGQQVQAGGNVNLYFGGVTWSGGQFYLMMSRDGYSQVSTGDIRYTPTFDVSNLTAAAISTYTDPATGGTWTVGHKWVNGTIKKDIAGGNYFIKAFDGTATAVAVTDTYIVVVGTVEVVPASGPGGASLELKTYAMPPAALVNISYFNPISAAWVSVADLVAVNDLGQLTYPLTAPDLKEALGAGLVAEAYTTVTFRVVVNATGVAYTSDYSEYKRGLMRVGSAIASSGNLYGNLTDLSATVQMSVDSNLNITGKWFRPGDISLVMDDTIALGTATANGTGFFTTVVKIPTVGVGVHTITITDAGIVFQVKISVTTTLKLSPTSGPVGTVVTVTGFGFPAATTTTAYNVTIQWQGYVNKYVAWALTDSSGMFTTTFTVPRDYGGSHTVVATANDTSATSKSTTFKVTPSMSVSPSTLTNSGGTVVATATGLDAGAAYTPNIDNAYLGASNTGVEYETSPVLANATGDIVIKFIDAGFRPGLHVITLYPESVTSPYAPAVFALFNVSAAGDFMGDMLIGVNSTVVSTNSTVASMDSKLVSMNSTLVSMLTALDAKIVAVQNGIATLTTNVGNISTSLTALDAKIVAVQNGIATLTTNVGTISTSISSLGGKIDSVSGNVASISTSIGTVKTTLDNINAKVSELSGGIAKITTDVGELSGTVEEIQGNVATIKTDVGTVKMDVSSLKADVADVGDVAQGASDAVGGMTIPIWVAVVLSLIAAIASIYAVISIRSKIAG